MSIWWVDFPTQKLPKIDFLAASKSLKKHCVLYNFRKKGAAKLRREDAPKDVQKQQQINKFGDFFEAPQVHLLTWTI